MVHVDVTTVDEWWTEWAKAEKDKGRSAQVSMIKIDVEGAELLGRVLFFVFFSGAEQLGVSKFKSPIRS